MVKMRFRDSVEREKTPDAAILQVGIFVRMSQCPCRVICPWTVRDMMPKSLHPRFPPLSTRRCNHLPAMVRDSSVASITRKAVLATAPSRFLGPAQHHFAGKFHHLQAPNSDAVLAMLRRTNIKCSDPACPLVRLASQIACAVFTGPFHHERLQNGLFCSLNHGQFGSSTTKQRPYDIILTQVSLDRLQEAHTKFTAILKPLASKDKELFTEEAVFRAKMAIIGGVGSIDVEDATDCCTDVGGDNAYDFHSHRERVLAATAKDVAAAAAECLGSDQNDWDCVYACNQESHAVSTYNAMTHELELTNAAKALYTFDRETVGRAASHHVLKAVNVDTGEACHCRVRGHHI